jgi:diguanylate cyclase (GGDEF)-like protein
MESKSLHRRRRKTDERMKRDRELTDLSLDSEREQTDSALKAWERTLRRGEPPAAPDGGGKVSASPARELARRIAEERKRTDEVLERERHRMDRILAHSMMLATRDALTDLVNAPAFMDVLELQLERCLGGGHFFALMYVDIDNFKQINDEYGHVAGDEVLRRISGILRRNIRKEDVAARLGGDEFAIIIQKLPPEATQEIANRIIARIHELSTEYSGTSLGASLGLVHVTCAGTEVLDARAVLGRADRAMYEAKASGRRIVKVVLNLRGAI